MRGKGKRRHIERHIKRERVFDAPLQLFCNQPLSHILPGQRTREIAAPPAKISFDAPLPEAARNNNLYDNLYLRRRPHYRPLLTNRVARYHILFKVIHLVI
jgi:hypothetical protein